MVDSLQDHLYGLCELARSVLADTERMRMYDASSVSLFKQAVIHNVRRALVLQGRRLDNPRNDVHLFLDLPVAVLRRIFGLLDAIDCVAVCKTCSILHEICLTDHSLWTTIVVPKRPFRDVVFGTWPSGHYQWPAVLLRRSFPDPVHATFALELTPRGQMGALLDLLTEVTSRAVSVTLDAFVEGVLQVGNKGYLSLGPPSLDAWFASMDALCQPAPFLRSFLLVRREYSTTDHIFRQANYAVTSVPLSTNIFGGHPGVLRSFCLRGIDLPRGGCGSLAMLRTLDYQPVKRELRISQLLDILSHLPQLEILGLTLNHFEVDADWSSFEHRSLSMASIKAGSVTLDMCAPMRPFFVHLAVRTLYIMEDTFAWDKVVGLFGAPEELRVAADAVTQVFDAVSGRSQLWLASYPVFPLSEFSAVLFGRLTTLTLHESLWDIDRVPEPAPALVSPCIVFQKYDWPPDHDLSMGIFSGVAEAPWYCPLLRKVAFSFSGTPTARRPTHHEAKDPSPNDTRVGSGTVSLADIATFLRTAVKFDAPRLCRVSLYAISGLADPDPAAAFIHLYSVAEEIESFAFCSPLSRGLFDSHDAFLQPPASHFDPSVYVNDLGLIYY